MEFVSMQPEGLKQMAGFGTKVAVFLLSSYAEACHTYRDHRFRGLYMFLRLQNIKNLYAGIGGPGIHSDSYSTQYLARKQAVVAKALNILNQQPMLMLIQYS